MSLAFLFHYFMLNMFRMLIYPSSGFATYLLSYFMGCIALVQCGWCYGVVWLGWCGILMQAEAHVEHEILK